MPSAPFFSVIIPTYNRADKVVRAVKSVLAQTWQDYEIVVIDDGSTDNTADALKPFEQQIRYFYTPNGGVAAARNYGIAQSKGQYLAFLDADDRWLPEMLDRAAQEAQSHPSVGLLCSGAQYVDENGHTLWTVVPQPDLKNAYRALLHANFVITSGAVVQKSCLDTIEKFDATLHPCEDWDLWIRLVRNHRVQTIPGAWVLYEYSGESKLTSNYQRWLESHDRVLEKAFAADPSLNRRDKRSIRASLSYIKGRICLEAGDDRMARFWFWRTITQNPFLWKAWVYCAVFYLPFLRARLPQRVKIALRLPEAWQTQNNRP